MSPAGRFRFSLETVLKVRGLREEQARWEVAQAQSELARLERALAETKDLRTRLAADLQSPEREWTPQEFSIFKTFLEHLKTSVDGFKHQVEEQKAVIHAKMEILKQRHQERRLLERLREKQYAQYRRELMKVMEKETEDIVIGRFKSSF